jgi:hypothetical protein
MSQFSRTVFGNEKTLKVEGAFFSVQDVYGRLKFRLFGASESPFEHDAAAQSRLSDGGPTDATACGAASYEAGAAAAAGDESPPARSGARRRRLDQGRWLA